MTRDPIEEKGGENLYAYVGNDPINGMDPTGLWKLSEHETMTKEAFNSAAIHNAVSEKGRTNFLNGLVEGVDYPDIPEGYWGLHQVFTIGGKKKNDAPKTSLTYKTHFGENQYWHAMAFNETEPVAYQQKLVDRVLKLVQNARLVMDSNPQKAGNFIGQALHTIQDSYALGHVSRDPKTMIISQFQDYGNQNPNLHGQGDIKKGNEVFYSAAEQATSDFLKLILVDQASDAQITKMLKNNIFQLRTGIGGAIDVKMGGTVERFK